MMKKRLIIFAGLMLAAIAGFAVMGLAEYSADVIGMLEGLGVGSGVLSLAGLPWLIAGSGEFKELKQDEFEQLAEDEQKQYYSALAAHRKKQQENLEAEISRLKTEGGDHAGKIEDLYKQLREMDMSKLESLERTMKEQGELLAKLRLKQGVPKTVLGKLRKQIADSAEKIRAIKNSGTGVIEFKAVADMTTGSAANPDGIPEMAGVQMAPASNVNLKEAFVDGLVTTLDTDLPSYPYTDTIPKEGDAAFTAEGALKPQADFKIETRYANPVKCAVHAILTDESATDIRGLQSIATDYLLKKHNLKRQNGILFGDGVGENPTGATVYGRTFVAGGMALAVESPTIMDVINAAITDIAVTPNFVDEGHYMANVALMSYIDFFTEFVAKKDSQGHPLFPTASLFGNVVIGGVTIVPFTDIPAGKVLVADMSKYNVSRYLSYSVKVGYINDQFITNKFTMVGESRFHAFVKELDKRAFIYDDIATIRTAITKP